MIRFAAESDLRTCRKFDDIPPSALRRIIRAKEVILAFEGEEAVGYLRLEYIWFRIPYIGLIVVREGSRGKGVGKRMLQYLEAYLLRKGHKRLFSSSEANQPRPQHWHRRMGFEESGMIAGINEGGIGEVFFRKKLGPSAVPARTRSRKIK